MPVEVKLPQLGESVYEGTIGRWLKQPGDLVEQYESLVEVITDKVNVEMPSPWKGRLVEILVQEGQTVPAGTPIALMEVEEVAPGEGAKEEMAGEAPPGHPREEARPRLSPLVRRLAEEHGVSAEELTRIPGTGTGGRITKEDLLRYVESRRPAPSPTEPSAVTAVPSRTEEAREGLPTAGDTLIRLNPIRRTIAERMTQSKREIPHAYGIVEVDMTEIVRWREAHKEEWLAREGVNITYTAFIVRATVEALRAFPIVNSTWTEEGILLRRTINIGVGVAIEEGLIVPVIKNAEEKSLLGIARELAELTRKAREGKLTLEEVQGGTFTITNPGVFGSLLSMPIIVPGQAAILAVDAIVKRPVVRWDAIAIREMMHLGLSFDHRIFDGAVAVQFLNHIKAKLEGFKSDAAVVSDF
ncbi:MAG: dihydrolipoamide acetyltransferase family protein [Armatimonadota bacterium]|nr:dihydrolipoamide acetyltransferase family protein [Armatimonadota bacterium]MDR5704145.1 dihydrolipoamide acetyltransferase family protein [Armatimonadota bacterium]